MKPAVTATFLTPRARQASAVSIAYSRKMVGIVVGVGDAGAAQALGGPGDRVRQGDGAQPRGLAALGNVPVLAEGAGEIAAGRAERQHRRARQEVVQRLLLDRVDAEAGRAAVAGELHALAVLTGPTHKAKPALAGAHPAESRTNLALDPAVLEPGPVIDFDAIVGVHAVPAAFAKPLLKCRISCRKPRREMQCGGLARRGGRAYISGWRAGVAIRPGVEERPGSPRTAFRRLLTGGRHARTPFIPPRSRASSIRPSRMRFAALIAKMREGARPDGDVAPKVLIAPACGHRLFRRGRGHRLRRLGAARRAAEEKSSSSVRPIASPSGASRSIRPWPGARRSARSRSRATFMSGSPRPGRRRPTRGRSPASIRSRCISSCCRRCCRPRSRSCRSWSATRRRTRSPPRCGSSGAARRRRSRSPPTSRISSSRRRPARSTTTPPGGSRVSTAARSKAGAPAAICRSAAR